MDKRPIRIAAVLCLPPLCGQVLIPGFDAGGTRRLFPSDLAVLELREVQSALPCTVKPVRPELGFDLVLRAGYEVRLRLRDLAGNGGVLTAIFRVTLESRPDAPSYFEQKWNIPPIEEHADGSATLEGSFEVGQGDYRVDWLMRDRQERICSAYWRVSARKPAKGGVASAFLPPGAVASTVSHSFSQAGSIKRSTEGGGLRVAVLLNIGPEKADGIIISPRERAVLLSVLRGIARDMRIASVSITAFNLQQMQVIFRQDSTRDINFAALNEAIDSLSLGTISLAQLAIKNGEARFLTQLAAAQAKEPMDALIFVGPKTSLSGMTRQDLEQMGNASCPVFYLTYNVSPLSNPWSDVIGNIVRHWRGREFIINTPIDLLSAWSNIMSRLEPAAFGDARNVTQPYGLRK